MKKFHQGADEHEPVEESESVKVSHRIQPPDEAEIVQLFEKCLSSNKVPILFSIEDQPYCKSFSESATHLPLAL